MSDRVEWATAVDCPQSSLVEGEEAGDGQLVTEPFALVLGPLVIEGTVDELAKFLAGAQRLLLAALESKMLVVPAGRDACVVCSGELDDDDHHTSEYGNGYAHDDCIADHRENERTTA